MGLDDAEYSGAGKETQMILGLVLVFFGFLLCGIFYMIWDMRRVSKRATFTESTIYIDESSKWGGGGSTV